MKKLTLAFLFTVLLAGCTQFNMQFQPTSELRSEYDHSSKSRDLTIYYNVRESSADKTLHLAVQNTANLYMSSLTVNYDNCCQAYSKASGRYNFANLGNLKNRSHKTMILKMEKDAKGTIVLRYSYIPVVEDKFLNSSSSYTPEEARDAVEGEVVLYIGR